MTDHPSSKVAGPPANRSCDLPPLHHSAAVIAARELRTLLRNRFLHVFAVIALGGGLLATRLAPSIEAIPFILLQLALYFVPLFSILIGLSSAHGELEEHPFLFSQPISRFAVVAGKAVTLTASLAILLVLAFASGIAYAPERTPVMMLGFLGLLLGTVFIVLGLAIGFTTHERSRGIIFALLFWVAILIAFDLLAYFAALLPAIQQRPLLWLSILLLNPVDAVRVAMLFQLEDIPFNVETDSRLITVWLSNLIPWVILLCIGWIAALLLWSRRQVERRES